MKKIVVAYSGGLDTSVILKWLKEKYNAEIPEDQQLDIAVGNIECDKLCFDCYLIIDHQ